MGTHGLSCRKNQGRYPRHNELSQVIHHSLSSAKIPSCLEPYGLSSSDRSRPDRLSMTPWSKGQFLVWDATCVIRPALEKPPSQKLELDQGKFGRTAPEEGRSQGPSFLWRR